MRKSFMSSVLIWVLLMGLCLAHADAKPVDTTTAKRVALNFMRSRAPKKTHNQLIINLVYTCKNSPSSSTREKACFYIFNTNPGFVIVSADDRIEPIIGYSIDGNLYLQAVPESMEEIFDGYVREIGSYLESAQPTRNAATDKWERLLDSTSAIASPKSIVIGPLLKTQWSQEAPFNLHCPDSNGQGQHTLTGCVATAMAQIIRYWEYPTQGVGSHTYTCNSSMGNYGTLSVNFGNATYNYSYMPTNVSTSSASYQQNAVAKLFYHCGVSVDMTYGIYASSASTAKAATSLASYFRYSTTYNTLTPENKSRSNYNDSDWTNLIKTELNEWRPVIYSGSGSGGHAFICDGYDDQGYFHFNWGWGGYLDGYFLLSSLTPGGHNYSNSQAAIIHIQGNTPMMRVTKESLSFLAAIGGYNTKSITVRGVALSSNITAVASNGFEISTDSVHFYSTLSIGTGTTKLYVRYSPTLTTLGQETGSVVLSSGSANKTISLIGRTYEKECNAPLNVQYTTHDGHVQLTWDEPTQEINTYRFSIDSTYNNYSRYGFGTSSYLLVQRACDSDLVVYHQKQLTQVSFYVHPAIYSATSGHKIKVYQGGSYENDVFNEGTLVLEQSVASVTSGWNTVTLNEPITINAEKELWYGVQFNTSVSNCIAVGTNDCVQDKGGLIYLYNTWYCICDYGIGNIPFKITIQDAPSSIENYTITRNSQAVGNTTDTQYQEHLTASGVYTYHVTANWDNDCSASSDDISINVITDCVTSYGDTTAAACEEFTWHGQTYIQSGNYTQTFTAANGCDSVVTLHLTINQPTTGNTTATACESFTWFDETYTQSGDYTHTILGGNADGCDSIVTLHLTINHATYGDTTAVACDEFTWHGLTYTETPAVAPTYTIAGGNANGCDSTVTLHLTINHATYGDTTAVACEEFTWHGQTYTETPTVALTYTIVGGNQNGCDSIVTLHLTINHATYGDTTAVACEEFTWHGQTYTQTPTVAPTYTITGGNADGCDSTVTLHLTINHATYGDTTAVACDEFTWHGQTYTETPAVDPTYTETPEVAPTYTLVGGNQNGCDSIVTLHLTINHATYGDTTAVACEEFTWHGQTYTETPAVAPTYTIAGGNANGCDSTVTLHLTINHATYGDTTAVACEEFTWHGQTYTETPAVAPTYTIEGGNADGCDSIVTLHLTINHATYSDTTAVACEEFTWHGQTYTVTPDVAPTYTIAGGNADGCDSIVTLHLTVNHGIHNAFTVASCEAYTWHDITYHESGSYTFDYSSQEGCASTDTLHLTVSPVLHTTLQQMICEYELPYRYTNGLIDITFPVGIQDSTFVFSFYSVNNCDSIVTLHLTINHATYGDTTAVACDEFTWHGQTYTQTPDVAPTFTIAGGNADGCDSIVTLHLTINHATYGDTTAVACDEFMWHGQTYTETPAVAPTYTITGGNADGCDSTVTLHLTINHATYGDTTAVACDEFTCHGQTYTVTPEVAPTFTIAGGNADGCDSIITLHLTINHATYGDTTAVACDEFMWHGQTYTETPAVAPTYTITGGNANGCDSIVTLHLTVNHSTQSDTTAVVCDRFDWYEHTNITESGTYTHTLEGGNIYGCDSTIMLHLTIRHATYGDTTAVACESFTWHGQTYTETPAVAPTYTIAGGNQNGCDSIVTLHLTINHATYGDTTAVACDEFTWHGQTYTETPAVAPTYTIEGGNADGCDSIVTLHLTINHATYGDTTVIACEEFSWHGQTYTQTPDVAPTYTIEGGNANGCDSTVTLHLTINHATYGDTTAVACEEFTWHGQTYTETPAVAPTYTITGGNANGCDSIVTLHLTINHATYGDTTAVACEEFTWHGQTYTETPAVAPTFTIVGGNANGCDSIVTLHLTINHATYGDTTAVACDEFTWHGQTYMETPAVAPTYTITGGNADGCDSIVTLHLTINHATYGDTTAVACDEFTWHGQTYTQTPAVAPTFTIVGGNANGCDSIVTLHLTIFTYPEIVIEGNTQITQGESTTLSVEDNPHWSYLWSTGDTTSSITITPFETTQYSVTATNGSCESSNEITVMVTTGIPPQSYPEIVLYPNPTTGLLHIEGSDIISVQVTDITGQAVAVYEKTNVLDLSHLTTGVYTLRIVTPNGIAVRKVIKQNQ